MGSARQRGRIAGVSHDHTVAREIRRTSGTRGYAAEKQTDISACEAVTAVWSGTRFEGPHVRRNGGGEAFE